MKTSPVEHDTSKVFLQNKLLQNLKPCYLQI